VNVLAALVSVVTFPPSPPLGDPGEDEPLQPVKIVSSVALDATVHAPVQNFRREIRVPSDICTDPRRATVLPSDGLGKIEAAQKPAGFPDPAWARITELNFH
jgi:hypothetical protein